VEQYIDLKWKSQIFDSQISFKIKPQRKRGDPTMRPGDVDYKGEGMHDGSDDKTLRYLVIILNKIK
jgi:hypothetical protein